MSPKTLTLPPTDRGMWRKVLALCHPDGHGDHETFIWVRELREHVAGDAVEAPREMPRYTPAREDDRDRVPYDAQLGYVDECGTVSAGYRKELRKSYAGLAGKKLENLKTEL